METQLTPVAREEVLETPALTDAGVLHGGAPSTDFSHNDSSIFTISDVSLSTYRNTPSGG